MLLLALVGAAGITTIVAFVIAVAIAMANDDCLLTTTNSTDNLYVASVVSMSAVLYA